jgi:ketosteroid isomerase-like protein
VRPRLLSLEAVDAQEERFAAAFGAGEIAMARSLYHSDVVYVSPTTRLFGWPMRIVGIERALEFIQLTITGLSDISYADDERALIERALNDGSDGSDGSDGAYVRVHFDFGMQEKRLRSTYVIVYRYRDGLIVRQELYYDPSAELERLPAR